jgi:hypothetical protein
MEPVTHLQGIKKYLFRSAILKKPEKRRFLRDDEARPHAK